MMSFTINVKSFGNDNYRHDGHMGLHQSVPRPVTRQSSQDFRYHTVNPGLSVDTSSPHWGPRVFLNYPNWNSTGSVVRKVVKGKGILRRKPWDCLDPDIIGTRRTWSTDIDTDLVSRSFLLFFFSKVIIRFLTGLLRTMISRWSLLPRGKSHKTEYT